MVLFGKPAEQILNHAEVNKVDLIIMSSHGRSGIMPWSLGSTVDKVFKKAGIPLIVVRAKEPPEEARLFSRIVVPLDGSEKSIAVLPYIKELAKILPCEVFPIQVVEAGRHVRTIGGLDYVRFKERDISSTKAAVKKYLESVCTDLALTKAKVSCEVRVGDAAREILKFADEKGCTLIAMSSHGHSGIEAWAMGSVTSKIVAGQQAIGLAGAVFRKKIDVVLSSPAGASLKGAIESLVMKNGLQFDSGARFFLEWGINLPERFYQLGRDIIPPPKPFYYADLLKTYCRLFFALYFALIANQACLNFVQGLGIYTHRNGIITPTTKGRLDASCPTPPDQPLWARSVFYLQK